MLAAPGGTVLERPVRVFVSEFSRPQVRPEPNAPFARTSTLMSKDRVLDVWAMLADGWILVADPFTAPAFEVWNPPVAALGWIQACEVDDEPQGRLVIDDGHPLDIVRRGDPTPEDDDGHACSQGGQPGRWYGLWPDGRGDCIPYEDMCGGPGLTPPSWEFPGPDELEGCMDCCVLGRSMVGVGDFCRAREPGWTWQCSADNEQLVCRPPARPSAPPATGAPDAS